MSIKIEVKGSELFDEKTERFIEVKPTVLILEHSLIAISKWESQFHIPFLREGDKTPEQLEYYFKCMTINQNVHPDVYKGITKSQQMEIVQYIKDPMTATTFFDMDKAAGKGRGRRGPGRGHRGSQRLGSQGGPGGGRQGHWHRVQALHLCV